MSIRGWWLAALCGWLVTTSAFAEDTQVPAQDAPKAALPSWAPGPLADGPPKPVPGRVASRLLGAALTIPPSWRADDVSWREVIGEEAKALSPLAEVALVIELAGADKQPLLTIYRVPLKEWREADRKQEAGPGRVTLTTPDKAFVVVRPPDAEGKGRFAQLRKDVEDAVGTLARYDAHHEERHLRPQIGTDFSGTLVDGSPVALHLEPGGALTLTWGKKQRVAKGKWLQREAQIMGHLINPVPKIDASLLWHFDGVSLITIKWDESALGNVGVRLEKTP
jgi:hypothetical protein